MPSAVVDLAAEIDEHTDRVAQTIGKLDDREAALLRELAELRNLRERYRDRIRRALAPKESDTDTLTP